MDRKCKRNQPYHNVSEVPDAYWKNDDTVSRVFFIILEYLNKKRIININIIISSYHMV